MAASKTSRPESDETIQRRAVDTAELSEAARSAQALVNERHVDEPLLLALDQITEARGAIVGGKARSLAVLAEAKFPVPAAFVVTVNGYRAHMARFAAELGPVRALLAAGEIPDDGTLSRLRAAIVEGELPAALRHLVDSAFRERLAGKRVAVRSSGTSEDLAEASFAGQYETYLNIEHAGVERAIKECFASAWQPRVLRYAYERKIDLDALEMAVVVQEMVQAHVSGVLFTVNPMTGKERECVVEAVHGLGEPLVSGLVEGDRFIVDPHTGQCIEEHIGYQRLKMVLGEHGNETIELGEEDGRAVTLDKHGVAGVVELGAAIQEHYGRPMDIEWAIARGRLYALQARPITKISFAPELGEWTTADFRDGGVSSAVCSPFMWSLYDLAFESSMPQYFKDLKLVARDHDVPWYKVFFARPYWSMGEVKKALEKIPGYDEDSFHADLGITPDPENPGKVTPTTVRGILGALPVLFALSKSYKQRLALNEVFVEKFEERKAPYDIDARSLAELDRETFDKLFQSLILDFYRHNESSYFTTIYNTANAKIDLKPVLDKVAKAAGSEVDELALVSGLSNLSHMRPLKEMQAIAKRHVETGEPLADETVREFAMRWKQHSRKELDIRVPRWPDDLDYVRSMLQSAIDNYREAGDPEKLEERQGALFRQEHDRILAALRFKPSLRKKFKSKLDLVRRYAWWREEMRDHSSYTYYLVRLWTCEAGRRLADEGTLEEESDVWYLEYQQIIDALTGASEAPRVRDQVRLQRRTIRSFRNFENPNEIGVRYGYAETEDEALSGNTLTGTGCSPGRVTGTARVVHSLEEADALQEGEILVTHFTDPGWTPLFARIGAVVTETGGVLSHAAVISREYGFPAVLSVASATRHIPDGATITVDGGRGIIEICEEKSS